MRRALIVGVYGLLFAVFACACGETDSDSGTSSGGTSSGGKGGGGTSSGGTSSGGAGTGGTAGGSSTGGVPGDGGICSLPKVTGPCEADIPSWYFNAQTGKCEPFSYGGCQGNANNFESADACVKACAASATNACEAITCDSGAACVYDAATPFCAVPCQIGGGGCPGGL